MCGHALILRFPLFFMSLHNLSLEFIRLVMTGLIRGIGAAVWGLILDREVKHCEKTKDKIRTSTAKTPAQWRVGWGLTKGVNMKAEGEERMGQGGQ